MQDEQKPVDDAARHGHNGPHGQAGLGRGVCEAGDSMAHAGDERHGGAAATGRQAIGRIEHSGRPMADAGDGQLSQPRRGSQGRDGPGSAVAVLADTSDDQRRRGECRAQAGVGSDDQRRRGLAGSGGALADTDHGTRSGSAVGSEPQESIAVLSDSDLAYAGEPRLQGREQRGTRISHGGGAGSTWTN